MGLGLRRRGLGLGLRRRGLGLGLRRRGLGLRRRGLGLGLGLRRLGLGLRLRRLGLRRRGLGLRRRGLGLRRRGLGLGLGLRRLGLGHSLDSVPNSLGRADVGVDDVGLDGVEPLREGGQLLAVPVTLPLQPLREGQGLLVGRPQGLLLGRRRLPLLPAQLKQESLEGLLVRHEQREHPLPPVLVAKHHELRPLEAHGLLDPLDLRGPAPGGDCGVRALATDCRALLGKDADVVVAHTPEVARHDGVPHGPPDQGPDTDDHPDAHGLQALQRHRAGLARLDVDDLNRLALRRKTKHGLHNKLRTSLLP